MNDSKYIPPKEDPVEKAKREQEALRKEYKNLTFDKIGLMIENGEIKTAEQIKKFITALDPKYVEDEFNEFVRNPFHFKLIERELIARATTPQRFIDFYVQSRFGQFQMDLQKAQSGEDKKDEKRIVSPHGN